MPLAVWTKEVGKHGYWRKVGEAVGSGRRRPLLFTLYGFDLQIFAISKHKPSEIFGRGKEKRNGRD